MPFRTNASIDANSHKGLILLNSITGEPLIATGRSLTNAQPLHVAVVDATGSQITAFATGGLSNNNAIPSSNNTGVLPALANAAAPSYSEGKQVLISTDLSGSLRVTGSINTTPPSNASTNISQINAHTVLEAGQNGSLTVGGVVATNSNVSTANYPILIAGSDYGGTPKIQSTKVDSSGKLYISTVDTLTTITNQVNTNIKQIGGSNIATAATGIIKVGLTDGSGNALTSTTSALDINIKSGNITGYATSSNQTGGGQKTQIVDPSNNTITSNSTATAGKYGEDVNILSILGTAPSTAGKLDVILTANPLVTAPLVGQSKIAITGTAVQLNGGTSQALTNGIIISAPSGNTNPICVGGAGVNNTADGTGNGYLLAPGASISFAVTDTNKIYINGYANNYVSWAGS
jgi:hypothetical protein